MSIQCLPNEHCSLNRFCIHIKASSTWCALDDNQDLKSFLQYFAQKTPCLFCQFNVHLLRRGCYQGYACWCLWMSVDHNLMGTLLTNRPKHLNRKSFFQCPAQRAWQHHVCPCNFNDHLLGWEGKQIKLKARSDFKNLQRWSLWCQISTIYLQAAI